MNAIQTTLKSLQIGAFATLLFASSCKKDKINSDPTITSFTPESGAVGTAVTITGTNFSTTATDNTVQFNGTAATVTAATVTSITTSVPTAATTGKITVAVLGKTVTSATDFTVGTTGTFDAFSYTNKSVEFGKKDSSIAPTTTRTTTSALTYTITDIKFNDLSLATSSYAIIPGTGTNAGTSTVALNANVTTGTGATALIYPAYKTNIFKLKADGSVVISSWCAQGVYKLYITASDGTNTKAAILTATITVPAGTITAVTYAGGNYDATTKTITITNGSKAWVDYATATATKTGTFTPYYWIDKVTKDGAELYADVEDKRNALGTAHKIWLNGTNGAIGLDGSATIGKYVLSVRAGDGGNSIAVGDITVDLQSFSSDPTAISYATNTGSTTAGTAYTSGAATITGAASATFWVKGLTKDGTALGTSWDATHVWFGGDGVIHWETGGTDNAGAGVYVLTISANAAGTVTTTYTITVTGTAAAVATAISYAPNSGSTVAGTAYTSGAATITGASSATFWVKDLTKDGAAIAFAWPATNIWFGSDGVIHFEVGPTDPTNAGAGTYVLTISANAAGTVTTTYTITVTGAVPPAPTIAYSPNSYTYGLENWATESVAPTVTNPPTGTAGTDYYIYIKSIKKDSETAVTGGPSDFYDTYKISAGNAAGADYGKLYWKYETPAGVYTITVEMTGGVTTTYTLTRQ